MKPTELSGQEINIERDVVRRLIRMETRVTQMLRCLGFRPGDSDREIAPSTVTVCGSRLIVSSADVPVGDIALVAIRNGMRGEIPIIVANVPWGYFTVHENPRNL